jgi:hypothetical protein
MFPFFTDAVTIGISHPSFEFSLLADGVPDLIDAVKIIDSSITQQSFLVAESSITQQSFLVADSSITQQSFLVANIFSDVLEYLKPSDNVVKGVEKDLGLLNTGGEELKEIKASIDTLNYAVSACFIATAASWFDLKQGVAGLLNEQQERILSDVTTELTVDAGNLAVIVVSAPKRLRGFKKKSFTLKSKNEGKVLVLMFSHEGIVETWQQHLPATKIVELEEQKKGLRYTFTKEETASDTNSPRAELRIELTKPLAPRPWRLLA